MKLITTSAVALIAAGAFAGMAQAQTTNNQAAVAASIAAPVAAPSVTLQNVRASIAALSPSDRSAAYSQFTPGAYGLLPELTLRTAEFEQQTINRYLRDFRAGGTGVNGAAGDATPGDRKFGSFLVGSARYGHYDEATDRSRVGYGATSVMGGIDYRLGAKSLVGLTGGYDVADVRLDPTSRNSQIRNWFAGGYGTLGVGPLYLDLFGTYGKANYDLRRSVNFGANTATPTDIDYTASTSSRTWLGGASTGLSFNFGGFEIEPSVGARYANIRFDGFSEGNGVGAIGIGREKYESVLGNAGVRIGAAYTFGSTTIRPEVRGAYRHEFLKDGQQDFGYSFGGSGTTLAFEPTSLRRNYYTAGAGLTVSGANSPVSFVVDYNGEFAKDRQINGITGGVRLTF